MANTVSSIVSEMQTATAISRPRNVGGEMGKNDFLMLLATQLRYQNPLEPVSDAEFASQLAQFSALEQMQNVNSTLTAMSSYQSYGLIGKFVVAMANVDGVMSEIPGNVDCVFTEKGVTFVQIGQYAVPISSIKEVYDNAYMPTPKSLIETSNNLIGRTVKASADGKLVEGVVTRVAVEDGVMYAFLDDGSDEQKAVRVETIYDIRRTDAPAAQDSTEKTTNDETNEEI